MNTLEEGTQLHWYKIERVLAQGAFGVTYTGIDTNLSQDVAIKEYFPQGECSRGQNSEVIPPAESSDIFDWGLERFQKEAQLLARLRHPNVVRVLSVFEGNGTAYMVMELEKGVTFEDAIKDDLFRDEDKLLHVIHALCDGLQHVHETGVLHRDIKPANIILRSNGQPVLIDFGAARPHSGSDEQQMTTLVTRGYAPHEQYDSEAEQGPWSDLYALGATLYRVVTQHRTPDALKRGTEILRGEPDPLQSAVTLVEGRYSAELGAAIDRALAFHAADRPQTIADWRQLVPLPSGMTAARSEANETADLNAALRAGASASVDPDAPVPELDISDLRTLVVDDEPFIRNLTKRILNRLGAETIVTAENGAQALSILDEQGDDFDIIMTDLNMPDMDGVALLRHLGERRTRAGIILFSGEDSALLEAAQQLAEAYDLAMLGTLQKPLKPDPLKRLLGTFRPVSHPTIVDAGTVSAITEEELLAGLDGDGLRVVYQPKVAITERRVVGMEALARWNHPERGLLGPGAFIPMAEKKGHIAALTQAVFTCAATDAGMWRVDGHDIGVSINLSMDTVINQPDLPDQLADTAAANGLEARHVTLEISENRIMRSVREPLEALTRLRLRGFSLSIDDFGNSQSSADQLKRMPFSELKLNRQLVGGANEDETKANLLRTCVRLGKSLRLKVVAEGVETNGEWELARESGCDVVQGFVVSKPMEGDDVPDFISNWEKG